MTRTRIAVFTLVAVVAAGVAFNAAFAADEDISLDGAKYGSYVTGPKLKQTDLKGKVIVFEYWGDRCGPCIASIPHLVELQEKHGRDKLVIIANQVWTKSTEAAKKAWMSKTDKDIVTVVNHGGLKGVQVRGVPHSFVFDGNGNFVWRGHPRGGLDGAIEKALKATENADAR